MRHPFRSGERASRAGVSLGTQLWGSGAGGRRAWACHSARRKSTRRCKPSQPASRDASASRCGRRVKTAALGGDLTSVKCAGQWLHLGLTVDSRAAAGLDDRRGLGRRCGDPQSLD
jgi:hypothetical protein